VTAERVYLDWNATTPLRAEARAAMIAAMDVVGNPSSVHAEGRAARGLIERARADLAQTLGTSPAQIVFTSGATEAAALACGGRGLVCSPVEHDAVLAWCTPYLACDDQGRVAVPDPTRAALQMANSETGVLQDLPPGLAVTDLTQAFGKIGFGFDWLGVDAGILSAHKFGGPKGVGALVLREGLEVAALLKGGGQEMGRRAGTENLIGIAGMAAAARAAQADLDAGVWDEVAELRGVLENALEFSTETVMYAGRGAKRLPNTTCIVAPGWKGETQVMRMDLAGFAVSAGSACSSGKLRASRVLDAMGIEAPDCALRISLGPGIGRETVERFAETWTAACRRHRERIGG